MKRALVVALVLLAGAVAAFFFWPRANDEPARVAAEGAYSPAPERVTGSALVRRGAARDEIAGKVVDGRGQAIPGADVFLARHGAESMAGERCDCPVCQKPLLECACPAGADQVAGLVDRREGELLPDLQAKADEDGEFRFEDPPSGPFVVWATAHGYAPAFRHGMEPGMRVELALGPAQAVVGKVVDEDGNPVAGALLTGVFALLPRFADATSGEDGAFRLEDLGLGPHFLVATSPGFLPAAVSLVVPAGAPLTLTLARPRALEGTVSDRRAPAKNVMVRLNADHFARRLPAPQGTFRVEGLSPGTYTVVAQAGRRFASAQVELREAVTRVELSLEEALAVRGRVHDDRGEPVGGALVAATVGERRLADTRSDETGAFGLDALPPGARLTAWREGYEPGSARVPEGGGEVDLVLHAQAVVAGTVVSPRDEPLPQVQVVARGAGHGAATSDAQGTFRIFLQSGGPVTLLAHHSTYGVGEVSVDAPASGVKLKLSTLGAIRARLLDAATGQPVSGGRATAWKDDPALQRYDTFSSDVPSGDDGSVVLAGLPAGAHRVRFSARGYQPAERRNVPVPESGELDLGEIALDPGKEIAGVVLKDDGAPAAGAAVHARAKGTRATEGVTAGRDGTFSVTGLKEGTYLVTAFLDKSVAEATARTGDRKVVLRLPAASRLRGRVLDRDGRPLGSFAVDGAPIDSPDGRFEVTARVWRDTVFFRVAANGYLTAFRQARLSDSGIADAGDVVLDKALSIQGTVVDEARQPVPGAAVMVGEREHLPGHDGPAPRTVSGADGTFRLDGFAPGPVVLLARRGSLVGERALALPVDEGTGEVVITLHGKGSIEGSVRGPDGKPAAAELHTRTLSTTSDAMGRYRLDGLVPGSYTVLAVLDTGTFQSASREVQVSAGQASRLDFDLSVSATLEVLVQGATTGNLHVMRAGPSSLGGIRAAATRTVPVAQGTATVPGLQEGTYSVYFWGPDAHASFAEGTVEVPASGTVRLVLSPQTFE